MNVFRILFSLILMIAGSSAGVTAGPTPEAFACPVTAPTESRPDKVIDPFDKASSLHYENGLWVTIPEEGVLELAPEDAITFGPLEGWRSTTVTWLREEGVEGFIEVSGERFDEESEFSPQTPLSPQRQYVRIGPVTTGLAFPSEGCWEVVGSVGEHEIAFVVEVLFGDVIGTLPASS